MLSLARTVRFCVSCRDVGPPGPRHNTFGGWPSMPGVGAFYEMKVRCLGEADDQTGYAVNIRELDDAVRAEAIPPIQQALQQAAAEPGAVLREIFPRLQKRLDARVTELTWQLTPSYSVTLPADMSHVILKQQFEFAASHRLHQPRWSEEENRRVLVARIRRISRRVLVPASDAARRSPGLAAASELSLGRPAGGLRFPPA